MIYSKYNINLHDFPQKDYTTIYNLFSKKIICCKSNILFPSPSTKIIGKLNERGLLTDDIKTEHEKVVTYFEDVSNSKECLNIMLLLTGKCNFRCVYCYESEMVLPELSSSVFESSLLYIEKMMEKGYKKLHVTFYGGEPLMKKELLNRFLNTLYNKYEEYFTFSIVTNGSLLKENEVYEWLSKGLTRIKVTIDGNEESHNKKRPYKNGNGSYKDIIGNLQTLNNKLDILINIVVDENLSGVEEMIDELNEKGINAKFTLSLREPETDNVILKEKQLIKFTSILKEKKVFHYSNIGARHGEICSGKKQNFFVIDMDGYVYGCNGNLQKEKSIGKVDENVSKLPYSIENNCLKCRYLPICFGECKYNQKCQREYFDIVVPKLLKLYIQAVEK